MRDTLEFVTHSQFDSYAKRVMNKNLRVNGSSLSWTSIIARAHPFVAETQTEGMWVRVGWREAMKAAEQQKGEVI